MQQLYYGCDSIVELKLSTVRATSCKGFKQASQILDWWLCVRVTKFGFSHLDHDDSDNDDHYGQQLLPYYIRNH